MYFQLNNKKLIIPFFTGTSFPTSNDILPRLWQDRLPRPGNFFVKSTTIDDVSTRFLLSVGFATIFSLFCLPCGRSTAKSSKIFCVFYAVGSEVSLVGLSPLQTWNNMYRALLVYLLGDIAHISSNESRNR